MRIIAGEHRGRQILPPAADTTRPITDRVKQSLFDIIAAFIPNAQVYDCFAGTGSMGLECLSRGAAHVTFFEADRSAASLLKRNIEMISAQAQSRIISTDLFKWFSTAPPPANKIDLLFLDPPYRFLKERAADLRSLAVAFLPHLSAHGTIIFRHDSTDALALAPFQARDTRTYGSMTIDFLSPVTPIATDYGQQTPEI